MSKKKTKIFWFLNLTIASTKRPTQTTRHFVKSNVAVVEVKHDESSDDVSQTSSVREKIRGSLRKRVKEKIKLNVQVGFSNKSFSYLCHILPFRVIANEQIFFYFRLIIWPLATFLFSPSLYIYILKFDFYFKRIKHTQMWLALLFELSMQD